MQRILFEKREDITVGWDNDGFEVVWSSFDGLLNPISSGSRFEMKSLSCLSELRKVGSMGEHAPCSRNTKGFPQEHIR